MVKCKNIFCVYWLDNSCTLEEIAINQHGSCAECIYVQISEEDLKYPRQAQVEYYNKKLEEIDRGLEEYKRQEGRIKVIID